MTEDRKIAGADALRSRIKGTGLSMAWFAMGSVPMVELGGRQGFDAIVLDLQHGLWDRMSAHLAVSVVAEIPVIMRVAANTPSAIGEALDSGAQGVLVPLVETADQARAAVAAAQFPGDGIRSGGGVRPLGEGFSRYMDRSGKPWIGIMIETLRGVENAAAIAAVAGVDIIFIGTGDLALSLGCFPDLDDRHETACSSVQQDCLAAGVACGIFTVSLEAARNRLQQGYAAVVAANDIDVTVAGFASASLSAGRPKVGPIRAISP